GERTLKVEGIFNKAVDSYGDFHSAFVIAQDIESGDFLGAVIDTSTTFIPFGSCIDLALESLDPQVINDQFQFIREGIKGFDEVLVNSCNPDNFNTFCQNALPIYEDFTGFVQNTLAKLQESYNEWQSSGYDDGLGGFLKDIWRNFFS